jgi:hypothetical protein
MTARYLGKSHTDYAQGITALLYKSSLAAARAVPLYSETVYPPVNYQQNLRHIPSAIHTQQDRPTQACLAAMTLTT